MLIILFEGGGDGLSLGEGYLQETVAPQWMTTHSFRPDDTFTPWAHLGDLQETVCPQLMHESPISLRRVLPVACVVSSCAPRRSRSWRAISIVCLLFFEAIAPKSSTFAIALVLRCPATAPSGPTTSTMASMALAPNSTFVSLPASSSSGPATSMLVTTSLASIIARHIVALPGRHTWRLTGRHCDSTSSGAAGCDRDYGFEPKWRQ